MGKAYVKVNQITEMLETQNSDVVQKKGGIFGIYT
jgi:hypothetical protein